MPATINIHQAKTQLSSLVARAEAGEEPTSQSSGWSGWNQRRSNAVWARPRAW